MVDKYQAMHTMAHTIFKGNRQHSFRRGVYAVKWVQAAQTIQWDVSAWQAAAPSARRCGEEVEMWA